MPGSSPSPGPCHHRHMPATGPAKHLFSAAVIMLVACSSTLPDRAEDDMQPGPQQSADASSVAPHGDGRTGTTVDGGTTTTSPLCMPNLVWGDPTVDEVAGPIALAPDGRLIVLEQPDTDADTVAGRGVDAVILTFIGPGRAGRVGC